MQISKFLNTVTLAGAMALFILSVMPLSIAADDPIDEGIELTRDATELDTLIRESVDPNVLDTALVLTNQTRLDAKARCLAFDDSGGLVARAWLRIPGNGMRIFLASDMVPGRFVGSVRCKARGRIVGSAFVLGSVFSDVQVKNATSWDESRISAPVVVSI